MIKLVLFDIDGTLVRTGKAGIKAFSQAFADEFGLNHGSEKLKFAGRTDYSLVREFFLQHGVTPTSSHFERFFARYLDHLEQVIVQCDGAIIPGVHTFMKELRALENAPAIGLLTGNVRRGAEIKLRHFSLWQEFQFGGFADDHEERDCIAAIARQRGCDFIGKKLSDDEVLVLGDTPLDVRCARAIGAKVIAVATGGHTREDLALHQPDWAVADLNAISAKDICA
ncbi:MAG: gph 2 [Verrucomicrobiales bacterium]|nr:gph 2 [Verrucomicrobiales bacterium]